VLDDDEAEVEGAPGVREERDDEVLAKSESNELDGLSGWVEATGGAGRDGEALHCGMAGRGEAGEAEPEVRRGAGRGRGPAATRGVSGRAQCVWEGVICAGTHRVQAQGGVVVQGSRRTGLREMTMKGRVVRASG